MDCDIAIAGGGPAGLAAACSILRAVPKLRVKVIGSHIGKNEYTDQTFGSGQL